MGSSNTDDSGYEAGYETDADESELSEWESGTSRRGHKRKLEALVHLTMRLNFAESSDCAEDGTASSSMTQMPPPKTTRALGTKPAGLRLSLALTQAAATAPLATPPWPQQRHVVPRPLPTAAGVVLVQ